MAKELKAILTADISKFTSAMDLAGMGATQAAGAIAAAFAIAAGAVIALETASISAAKNYETLRLRVQLLAGDMKKGAAEFEIIKKLAEESAFSTEELISAYTRLRGVTGKDFALDQIENIAFASKIAGVSVEGLAARIGELVLKINSGRTGAELAETLSTLGTAFGDEATLELVKMARAGAKGNDIIKKMTQALGRLGPEAKQAFGASAEGLEAQLGGLFQGGLANLGEGPLEAYKELLQTLLKVVGALGPETEDLGVAMTKLLTSLNDVAKSEETLEFLKDAAAFAVILVDAFTLLLRVIDKVAPALRALYENSAMGMLTKFTRDFNKETYLAPATAEEKAEARANYERNKLQTKANKAILANYPQGPELT